MRPGLREENVRVGDFASQDFYAFVHSFCNVCGDYLFS